jgi:hypothetical protein
MEFLFLAAVISLKVLTNYGDGFIRNNSEVTYQYILLLVLRILQ